MKTDKSMKYYVAQPDLSGNERKYLNECIDSGWLGSEGPFVKKFEESFAKWHGEGFKAITTTSGTTALEVAVRALGIGPGHEVILPTHTMIAVPNAVAKNGAKVVLVDSSFDDWNMNVYQIEKKINRNTRAIIAVHTYGHPVDMEKVMDLANDYGLAVIEDCAESHGAMINGRMVGTFGDVACYSFYANKILAMGEGGACVTKDEGLAEHIRYLRTHTFSPRRHFWHRDIGYNFRISNLQAAVGLAQLERIEEFITAKRRLARRYTDGLDRGTIIGLQLPPEKPGYKNVYWMYGMVLPHRINRDNLQSRLAHAGIETRTFFIPIHRQPCYKGLFDGEEYPIAEVLSRQGLYLPSSPLLKEEDIDYITKKIKEAIK